MAKKQFKAESKRLLDLMINSIYTNKEIFLRELISNASDAIDKLSYISLTDDKVGMNRSDFYIGIEVNKDNRTLTVFDNGVGMTKEELESNLGTIAKSGSLQFKKEIEDATDVDIIGQFGVGFYSAFMVSDNVTVTTKAYGSDVAYEWTSNGVDGYTVKKTEKESVGTEVVMKIKENTEDEDYDKFIDTNEVAFLVKKYSDYVRFPIKMEVEKSRKKEGSPDDKPEWEEYREIDTLNSMVPLWQRPKKDITKDKANEFYKEKFGDFVDPLNHTYVNVEGTVNYKALVYIPSKAPYNFGSRDFEAGLQLYSSGVLIMDKCSDLVPDYFRFVCGVVDSQDISLNISREMLQQTKVLKVISTNLEKKIKSALLKMLKDEREKYLEFWKAFGRYLKYGMASEFGVNKDALKDLILFPTVSGESLTSLDEYVKEMKEDQEFIYYASGESVAHIMNLPQTERIKAKGYNIICLVNEEDEFAIQILGEYGEKKFKSINADDALPETDEEKEKVKKQSEDNKELLEFMKDTLGDKIFEARISKKLVSFPVCMTAEGEISFEMEKYFKETQPDMPGMMAQRVLEINPDSDVFKSLKKSFDKDKDKTKAYIEILYNQALLIAGLPIEDPASYTNLICDLMN